MPSAKSDSRADPSSHREENAQTSPWHRSGPQRPSSRAARLAAFSLGPWLVEPALGVLRCGEAVRHLEPKLVDVLVFLAARPGEVVPKELILDTVWPDVAVGHHAFWRCIAGLRKALGDDARTPRFIETIPQRGYRLIAPVAASASAGLSSESATNTVPSSSVHTTATHEGPVITPNGRAAKRARRGRTAALGVLVSTGLLVVLGLSIGIAQQPTIAIAVTPLHATSMTTDDRKRAAAMTDALRIAIGALPGVALVSHDETGAASHRLIGTLQRYDRRSIVMLRLVRSRHGIQVWAERLIDRIGPPYEGEQDLAQAAAAGIAARLLEPTTRAAGAPQRGDRAGPRFAADRQVRRGRALWRNRRPADLQAAHRAFRAALDIDPSHAPAWAGLADTESLLAHRSGGDKARRFIAAREAAERALRLDPELAAAHTALGFVALNQDWDFNAAESAYRHAIALDPESATARQWYAELLTFQGRHDQALIEIERAWRADPNAQIVQAIWGRLLGAAGHHDAAYRHLRATVASGAPFVWLYNDLATVCAQLGRTEESLAWRLRWLEAAGVSPEELSTLEDAIAARGVRAFWRYLLDNSGGAASRAAALAALGDGRQALAALAEAARRRGESVLHLAFDPVFDNLRSHPRFATLTGGVATQPAVAAWYERRPWAHSIEELLRPAP